MGNLREGLAALCHFLRDFRHIGLVFEGGQGSSLGDSRHAEMIAHFVEGRDQRFWSNGIAHPRAGHAIGFGKGPQADHIIGLGSQIRRCPLWCQINIGLIKHQKTRIGQVINQILHRISAVPAAHWIVRIGEIDQFRAQMMGLLCKALGILVIVQIWHHMQSAAIAGGMIIKRGIGPLRGQNSIPRRNGQAGQG